MIKEFSYYMPTKIVHTENFIDILDYYIDGRKTLLITSNGFKVRGTIKQIKNSTTTIVKVISNIKSHPEFKDLKIIYDELKDIDYELILAIGGGSVLDAAKFFSISNEKKEYLYLENIIKSTTLTKNYSQIPIISIPTTAGTGSELTPWATIWDMNEKKKYSLHLPDLFSEVTIYDASLTLTVPKNITIQTALDTLSHALESIWNKNANEITRNYAVKSAQLIVENIIPLSNNLDNIIYRDNIMKASMYAGMAFSQTQTAIAHAMSYYITAHKNIPHGIACSFTLPLLIDKILGKYIFVDQALEEIFGELGSNKLRKIFLQLNVPTDFKHYHTTLLEVLENINNTRLVNSLIQKEDIL